MITISEKVEELVNESPYLREAISDKLINLSALARTLQPKIQNLLLKDVTEGAVFIALQRYAASLKPYYASNPADFLSNLGLRSDLFEMTIANSPELLNKLSAIAKKMQEERASVFIFTQGLHETTVITSSHLRKILEMALKDEKIISVIPELTGITLQRSPGQVERTGVLQFPMRILAWEGISVVEVVTTLNEIMLVVRDFEVDRAVIAIRQALRTVSNRTDS